MTRIYLVRHGETEWNRMAKTQGRMDISLSETGYAQAGRLAERLLPESITAIYSSDLKRAYNTARVLADGLKVDVNVSAGLREMDFGCWEGMDFESIKKEYSHIHRLWIKSPNKAKIPGGEELIEVQSRSISVTHGILALHKGERVALVSHGITLKCLIFGLLGIDLGNLSKIRLDNCSVSIIEFRNDRYVLDTLNDTCHLNIKG